MCAHSLLGLEIEVEANHRASAGQVVPRNRSGFALAHDRDFVVKRETSATGNEWVIAKPDGSGIDVPEVGRIRILYLLGHPDGFVAAGEHKPGANRVMRLDQRSVP